MCGRFTLVADDASFEERFSFSGSDLQFVPSFNIAPTQSVLTVRRDGEIHAEYMRWGLIPSWAKDPKIGSPMINARSETLAEKPSFRTAFRRRRCLIPADGFFEWQKSGSSKRPMRIGLKNAELFAFAGLWEYWKDPQGDPILSCTIITTTPNEMMEPIHDRMPVILTREAEDIWLDSDVQDTGLLSELLVPYRAQDMEAYEVSTLVNSPRNNSPEVIAPVGRLDL